MGRAVPSRGLHRQGARLLEGGGIPNEMELGKEIVNAGTDIECIIKLSG
jgi:hypothetical protein